MLASDLPHDVGHHADGADNLRFARRRSWRCFGRCRTAAGQGRDQHELQKQPTVSQVDRCAHHESQCSPSARTRCSAAKTPNAEFFRILLSQSYSIGTQCPKYEKALRVARRAFRNSCVVRPELAGQERDHHTGVHRQADVSWARNGGDDGLELVLSIEIHAQS